MDKIVIGIDLGTTFSGVAWAYSGDPDSIEIVTNWEAEFSHCSDVEKTPTKLFYDRYNIVSSWGYGRNVGVGPKQISWFKLLLLDDKDVPSDIAASHQFSEAKRMQKALEKSAVDLIGDYLRKLWDHVLSSIERSVGIDLMNRCDRHVSITVPAIWPPYAQDRVRQAAHSAGILISKSGIKVTLGLVSEPEAAALATIKDMSKRSNIKVGDTIVVCDAGGGTVDLISYMVDSLSLFSVSECVKGCGGLCGGIFLDEGFLTTVGDKLGKRSSTSIDETRKAAFLNDAWEHGVKTQFQNQARTWLVDVPANATSGCGKRPKALEMTQQDIFNVFDPIIRKIEYLVEEQVSAVRTLKDQEPKYITLVGGFGRNRYLFERLKAAAHGTTSVLQSQGAKPWTAICRGAVIHGLNAMKISSSLAVKVQSRIARMSCGLKKRTDWNRYLHNVEDKTWDDRSLTWKARNQMDWFLKIGDNMDSLNPIRKRFHRLLEETELWRHNPVTFMVSYESEPSPRYNDTVARLCEITWNNSSAMAPIPTWVNPEGKSFRDLVFEVEMTSEGGTVEFSVFYDGHRVGSQHVSVDFA